MRSETAVGQTRPRQPPALDNTRLATPAAIVARHHTRRPRGGVAAAAACGAPSDGGFSNPTGAAVSRARTAASKALVSAAGPAPRALPGRLANSSYAATAPAPSPRPAGQ